MERNVLHRRYPMLFTQVSILSALFACCSIVHGCTILNTHRLIGGSESSRANKIRNFTAAFGVVVAESLEGRY